MKLSRTVIALTAAALIALLSFASATPALASFIVHETGTGATLADAEYQASNYILSNYYCTRPYTLSADGQNADGTWWATMSATCGGYV